MKTFIYLFLSVLPNFDKKNRCFVTVFSHQNSSGPTRFLHNLEEEGKKRGVKFERYFLKRTKVALMFLRAPSNLFYKLCQFYGVKIVLRVDGFYSPAQFNNAVPSSKYGQLRLLTEKHLDSNYHMQLALLKSDWVVYQSNFSKSMLDQYLFNRTQNYSIIENGVNLDHFKPVGSFDSDRHRILLFGTLRDVDLILCSLNSYLLLFEKNRDVTLMIIGSMTSEVRSAFDKWMQGHIYISETVEYVGKIDFNDLPTHISSCSVSISIKSGDWCPNAVLETMACGVPVVCQKFGGTSELVGDAGIVVESKEYLYDMQLATKVSDALLLVLTDVEQYRIKARLRSELFNIKDVAGKYLNILGKYE